MRSTEINEKSQGTGPRFNEGYFWFHGRHYSSITHLLDEV